MAPEAPVGSIHQPSGAQQGPLGVHQAGWSMEIPGNPALAGWSRRSSQAFTSAVLCPDMDSGEQPRAANKSDKICVPLDKIHPSATQRSEFLEFCEICHRYTNILLISIYHNHRHDTTPQGHMHKHIQKYPFLLLDMWLWASCVWL